MRGGIPVNDFGARMAIQYAREVAEFIDAFGYQLVVHEGHDPEVMRSAIAYMDREDPPLAQ